MCTPPQTNLDPKYLNQDFLVMTNEWLAYYYYYFIFITSWHYLGPLKKDGPKVCKFVNKLAKISRSLHMIKGTLA